MPGQLVREEGSNAVDAQKGFVEAVQVKDEMGVSRFPGGKFRTFKDSTNEGEPPIRMIVNRRGCRRGRRSELVAAML
jgi:hypothetical protein